MPSLKGGELWWCVWNVSSQEILFSDLKKKQINKKQLDAVFFMPCKGQEKIMFRTT